MTVDPVTIRRTGAQVPTAVSVVTTLDARGEPWGVTVGTVCLLSVTPPLVMFCLERGGASHEVLTTATRFLIHVLRDDQRDVANWFARPGDHSFCRPYESSHGLPLIPGTVARLRCARRALVPGGDHTVVIGAVEDADTDVGQALLYYKHEYCAPAPLAHDRVTRRLVATA